MGKRGPKTGDSGVKPTRKGYIRRYFAEFGKARMEHVVFWERAFGAIPEGFQIHHKNGDKADNRIENLECVNATEHKREHSGCIRGDDGEWIKPCRKCGAFKRVDTEYYKRKSGVSPWCRSCCIEDAVENKRKGRTGNIHSTVKPTDLMAYLARLITTPGGIVLDPFTGSGSTGKAAVREGFRFVGFELDGEYSKIADARISHEKGKK